MISKELRETVACLIAEVRRSPEKFADARAVVRRSGFGPTRLSEILREHYQTTPAELLLQARLDRAKRLLSSGEPIAGAAEESGFESLSAFHDRFRRHTGASPGAFRRGGGNFSMNLYTTSFEVPVGPFSLAADADGRLRAAAFGGESAIAAILPRSERRPDGERTAAAREQVHAYFRGERHSFELPLAPEGTPFQKRVWAALEDIPFGETRSYGEIARRVDSSPRAVGRAVATNPLCLLLPCHRVVGADGSLTGYAFGEEIKRRLLEHERSVAGGGGLRPGPSVSPGP